MRFLPALAGYAYARAGAHVYVNLFGGSAARTTIDGNELCLIQETDFPWDGNLMIRVETAPARELMFHVRIPGWARNQPVPSDLYRFEDACPEEARLEVNGVRVENPALEKGFAVLRRQWQKGDTIHLRLPMPVRRVRCHENVVENRGRVALQRGPLVYCVEAVDNGGQVRNLALPAGPSLRARRTDLLGGVTVLRGTATRRRPQDWPAGTLYRPGPTGRRRVPVVAVPYCAWGNRTPRQEMLVWVNRGS